MRKRPDKRGRGSCAAITFFISAGFPTKGAHLVSDAWRTVCFTNGASAEVHTGLHIYLWHRWFVLCFLTSTATAQLCWGITSRCSTKARPRHPTERVSRQLLPASGATQPGHLGKGLGCTVFLMAILVAQKHTDRAVVRTLTFLVNSQKLTDNAKSLLILNIWKKSKLAGRFSVTFVCRFCWC